MFYYQIGIAKVKDKTRKMIMQSEMEIAGKNAMNEEEAVDLLAKYDGEDRIDDLKRLLSGADYIACKIAEGAATREEYAEIIAQRQAWRDEINQLESGGGV